MFWLVPDDIQLTTDWCNDSTSDMASTALETVCLLPGKNVTFNCALPDSIVVWSSPHLGMQGIHCFSPHGVLGSNIHLQYDSLDFNNKCIRARATILDIDKTMNGLEVTCATPCTNYHQCSQLRLSTTFTVNVIGKKFWMNLFCNSLFLACEPAFCD